VEIGIIYNVYQSSSVPRGELRYQPEHHQITCFDRVNVWYL